MGCFIGLFGAYSLIPPTTCPCGTYTCLHWRQSRAPGSLTLVSVTTKHISLQWACNKHLSMVELPNATGRLETSTWWSPSSSSGFTTWPQWNGRSFFQDHLWVIWTTEAGITTFLWFLVFALWLLLSQWFSCLAQFHLRGRGWTNFSPLFNDWDDTGPPPTSTSRLWVTWDIYVGFAMTSRSSTERLGDFSSESVVSHLVSWVSSWVACFAFGWALVFGCVVCVLFGRHLAFCSHLFSNMWE